LGVEKKTIPFFNGTRNLDCAVRSNIAHTTPAGSIAEYFQKYYKESKMNLRNEDKRHEIQPNEHGSFKLCQKSRATADKCRRASIREAQHL